MFHGHIVYSVEIPDLEASQEIKSILLKFLQLLGTKELSEEETKPGLVPNQQLALLLKGILARLPLSLASIIYEELLSKIDNDRAEAYVIDCLRMDSREVLNLDSAKKILDFALYCRKEMLLEEVERVSAAVSLLKYLLLKQTHSGTEVVSAEQAKKYKS